MVLDILVFWVICILDCKDSVYCTEAGLKFQMRIITIDSKTVIHGTTGFVVPAGKFLIFSHGGTEKRVIVPFSSGRYTLHGHKWDVFESLENEKETADGSLLQTQAVWHLPLPSFLWLSSSMTQTTHETTPSTYFP